MKHKNVATKIGLKNVFTGKYLNVKGLTPGTTSTGSYTTAGTYSASQPRVSAFEDIPSFYWNIKCTEAGCVKEPGEDPDCTFNIISQENTNGALSNEDYPQNNWPPVTWPSGDVSAYKDYYAASITGNLFNSEPCGLMFPFKLVQWRYDSADWENCLKENAYRFYIIEESF